MNLEIKVNNIINNLNEPNLLSDLNCNVVLDISEPMMFVLNQLDEYYLAYVMHHKTMFYNNKKADVSEILISNTNFVEIKNLLKGEVAIKDALFKKDCTYKIGKIGSKVYPPKLISSIKIVENKIPKADVCFDEKLPNRVNLKDIIKKLEEIHNKYNLYYLASETKSQEVTFSFKNSKQSGVNAWDYDMKIIENRVGTVYGD